MDILYETEDDRLTIKDKIRAACAVSDMTLTELGERMGMSQQTFSSRLKVGKFTQEELEKMAHIMGAEYISQFKFPNGTII